MSGKKGFFNFFKGWSNAELTAEEKQQREYALAQQKNEANNKEEEKYVPKKKPQEKKVKEVRSDNRNNKPREKETTIDISPEIEAFCIEKLEELLYLSKFLGKVRSNENDGDKLYLEIYDAEDDAGRLIGKSGQTLYSFQTLLKNFVIRKFNSSIKISIDAGDYRNRRLAQIKEKALKAAEKVKTEGKKMYLEPMSPSERRAVHVLFETDSEIRTLSEGSGHTRRIVLVRQNTVSAD